MSRYELSEDNGSQNTSSGSYKLDPDLALANCQQIDNGTYVQEYDVGHIAAIDHLTVYAGPIFRIDSATICLLTHTGSIVRRW